MSAPLVTFLSDYGYKDEFVGVCHGVIAGRCPQARVIDVTHGIAPGDVRAGALALRAALPYVPAGVHLAVVDPGVGGNRRAVALLALEGARLFVGPDNGLLTLAAEDLFGGIAAACDIGNSTEARRSGSRTFDGRDVFAPVAGALAAGAALEELGEAVAVAGLVRLELPAAVDDGESLLVPVLSVDGFGNVELARFQLSADSLVIELAGGELEVSVGQTFGDVAVGELVAYVDSRGAPAIGLNGGSAAARLGVGIDGVLRLRLR